ncbi:MAG: type IV secretory system conjugative DNA transfer family protein [Treponema sp.]|nr:type IV secretory system conjugative DNA transfer family protein [Treponema sp.]MBR0099998.1 type IV secretory system conjugative DNA transfer family protein [Treponema sp.]
MRDKEEFSRTDPDARYKIYWLAVLNWIVPIICILIGLFVTTQKFAPLMNYDPAVIGNPLFVLRNGYRVYNPLMFILGMFKYAFNDTYSYYFFQAVPAAFFWLVLAVLLFVITSIIVSAHQKNQHIHGTARWANVKDLEKYGLLERQGVVCCELESAKIGFHVDREKASVVLDLHKNWLGKPGIAPLVCHSGRTNTWLIAQTRHGKGVNSIMPSLVSYGVPYYEKLARGKRTVKGRGSVIVFDPKGENWAATSGYRSKFSTCIPFRPLDPAGNTAHYNPIHEIPDSPSEAFSWADMIGGIFFGAEKAKSGGGDGASEYFNNMARDIFAGVVMHVRFSKRIPWEKKNLSTVLDRFSQAKTEEEQGDDEDGGGCGAALFAEMREEGVHVRDDGTEAAVIHDLIVKAANRSETQNPKERSSTFSTVFSKINLFQDPLLAQSTAYSDFSVDDFIDSVNGISLYLIVPYNHIQRIAPIFRMVITFMIKKFSSGTTNANEIKLKIPCMFLLDEFPVLGYFPDIAQNAGILAGYGVTFFIVTQSVNQIVDIYGENHPFFDHCKTLIIFTPGNIKDAKQFSETIGNRSVLLDNISASGSKWQAGFSNISRSSQETQTSLISPDELMKLEFNRAIVFNNSGMPPYKGKKVVYYEDPRFKNKTWLPEPSVEIIQARLRKLPSHKKKHIVIKDDSIQRAIKKISAFKADDVIPAEFSLFA